MFNNHFKTILTLTATLLTTACAEMDPPTYDVPTPTAETAGQPQERKTTNPNACYIFQEISPEEKESVLRPVRGLWMSAMPGWMSETSPSGDKILSKSGFEVTAQKLGTVNFERNYMDSTDSYQRRTYAERSIADARISRPRQGGDWDGFRIVETPSPGGGCNIIAIKLEGEKLQIRGFQYRYGTLTSEDEFWSAGLGFSEYKRTY